jgi:hypothetical protein
MNGLQRIPTMRMSDNHSLTMEMIDLSMNRIQAVEEGLIERVQAKHLRLDGNRLGRVAARAFAHCKFVSM